MSSQSSLTRGIKVSREPGLAAETIGAARDTVQETARAPVLDRNEEKAQRESLSLLQDALLGLQVHAVLAGRRRLCLPTEFTPGLTDDSGPTAPVLYVFTATGTQKVTTDGKTYFCGGDQLAAEHDTAAREIVMRRWP
jgi:hypothetical protein